MSEGLLQEVYLEVSHHDQTHGVGAAGHQSAGVDPTSVAVFDHLGVAQKAHHHHCRTHGRRRARLQFATTTTRHVRFLRSHVPTRLDPNESQQIFSSCSTLRSALVSEPVRDIRGQDLTVKLIFRLYADDVVLFVSSDRDLQLEPGREFCGVSESEAVPENRWVAAPSEGVHGVHE